MNADDIFNEVMNKQKGQRGKKRCPDCDTLVGVRSFSCDCGYRFVDKKTKAEKREEADQPTEEELLYAACIGAAHGRLVYAGSGRPSARLNEISLASVCDYCEMVVYEGLRDDNIMTPSAIKGYIQHQFGYNSEEYQQAAALVDQWYDEKIGVDTPSGDEYNEEK